MFIRYATASLHMWSKIDNCSARDRDVANRSSPSTASANVDAVSGTLLRACGLTDAEYYTVLFGLARCAGIAAQIVDERTVHRNGKGVPIYRPSDIPVNQKHRRLKKA